MIFHDYAFMGAIICLVILIGWMFFKIKNPYIEAMNQYHIMISGFYHIADLYPKIFCMDLPDNAVPVKVIHGIGLEDHCCGKEHIVSLVGTWKITDKLYFRCEKCGKVMVATYA